MSKKKTTLVLAFSVIGITVLGLAAAVYAKYISTITNTSTATVAKWAFTSDNTGGSVTCELDHTYDSATLVANKIAPGTRGKCPIEVSNENTEVGIRYDIKVNTITNQPTHLKFYTDDTYGTELSGSTTIHGTLRPGETPADPVYVYWEWPYVDNPSTTAYDEIDTADGEAAKTMTMTFDVTGTQVQPQ